MTTVCETSKIVFVDVDDTLVSWKQYTIDCRSEYIEGVNFYLNPDLVDKLKRLKARGYSIVLWSQAGGDWAGKVCGVFKLQELVDLCMSKPSFYIDDKPASEWMVRHDI